MEPSSSVPVKAVFDLQKEHDQKQEGFDLRAVVSHSEEEAIAVSSVVREEIKAAWFKNDCKIEGFPKPEPRA